MAAFERVLSGIPEMDAALDNIRLGDNVVFRVSDLDEFRLFMEPYVEQAKKDRRNIIYFRFASHEPLVEDCPEVKTIRVPLSHRFENFTVEIHNHIEREGFDAFYVFDCLSELQTAWATDLMMGNFFRVTCPFLFILDTVAFFPVIRGKHSIHSIEKIMDTTQLFLDVYSGKNTVYVRPEKVWNRESETMFRPHTYDPETKRFRPILDGVKLSRFYQTLSRYQRSAEEQYTDSWDRFFHRAKLLQEDGEDISAMCGEMCRIMMTRDEKMREMVRANFEPEDFFDEISDASDFTASFTKAPSPSGLGEYEVSIALEDEHGNRRVFDTKLSVITDTERPSIVVENEIVGYIGEGIAYKNSVRVTDNCFGVKLEVDSSDVDMEKEGTYVAVFTATDAAGNKTEAIVPVHIRGARVTEEMLNELIADVVKDWKKTTDKKELCKMIYEYVNDPTASASSANFTYVGHSNDESREDFRREAYLTLKNGQGDCYSYFSLSKALFEYFGLENKDIERTKGLTKDTHFWNMVNIGSEANPRWYFFDATRFAGKFTLGGNNGCLMTAAQLESYKPSSSGYGNNYYAFDSESYPKTETSIINEGFTWN